MIRLTAFVAMLSLCTAAWAAEWEPRNGPLMTKWAAKVSPENARPEYPRPQMRRAAWQNLNGLWEYAIISADAEQPVKMDGKILVPFPVESALSGVNKVVGSQNRIWYRRAFTVPKAWQGQRVILHFGAVDWHTQVWVNGKSLGEHKGGYDPFSFGITDVLLPEGEQELVVSVWDPTDAGTQARGKQVRKPNGIWYTPTTGIWQTVWLEPVPKTFIRSLVLTPDLDGAQVHVDVDVPGIEPRDKVEVGFRGSESSGKAATLGNGKVTLKVATPRLWSPDDPFLYDLTVTVKCADGSTDTVSSYFGMRKIELAKDEAGILRMMLNGKPLFQYGLLDQGFWPDGLYTAPTHEAMVYDIKMTKQLGFNMIRKHVKVEPATWYYECDQRGLLVWQDMPNGDRHIGPADADVQRSAESQKQYEAEWKRIISANRHSPSIVMWVPFNEGWGQFDTARIVKLTKELDPTRLVNNASGWTDRGVGDVHDIHVYPGPGIPPLSSDRAAVLGEFGGLGLPIEGHTWQAKDNWGYRSYTSKESLFAAYRQLIGKLRPLIHKGLSAAIYTQTTDVEIEVNGLLTYDRAVVKMPLEEMAELHRHLFLPPPELTTLVPTAQEAAVEWLFTNSAPSDNWAKPDFQPDGWSKGSGGFGTRGTPGAVIRTEWKSPEIWIRREFDLPAVPLGDIQLSIHHDEDAEVFLNGILAARLDGFATEYGLVEISPEARATLKQGTNVMAIHCKQTGGGQFIDAGLMDVVEQVK